MSAPGNLVPILASPRDSDEVVSILVSAFFKDPTWGWAFPDPLRRAEQHRRFWGFFVEGALRYPWVWLTPGNTATSVWIPPDGTEFSPAQEALMEATIVQMCGAGASRVLRAHAMFEVAHPRDAPHYYLTLLGTRAEHTGHGYGLALLAEILRKVDETGMPSYLEASNPANVPLYERYGFHVRDSFKLPEDGPEVFTMWREAAPASMHSATSTSR